MELLQSLGGLVAQFISLFPNALANTARDLIGWAGILFVLLAVVIYFSISANHTRQRALINSLVSSAVIVLLLEWLDATPLGQAFVGKITGAVVQRTFNEVIVSVLLIVGLVVVIELVLFFVLQRLLHYKYALAFTLVAPAFVGLALLQILPIAYNVAIAFSNMSLARFRNPTYGFEQGISVAVANVGQTCTQLQTELLKANPNQPRFTGEIGLGGSTLCLGGQFVKVFTINLLNNVREPWLLIPEKIVWSDAIANFSALVLIAILAYGLYRWMKSANFAYAGLAGSMAFIALLIGFFGVIPGLRSGLSGAAASLLPDANATVDTPVKATFFPIFWRTIVWTVINIAFHLTGGMILALLLNRKMYLRGIYRTLLVFPWAVPQVIAVLAWKGEFHFQYGYVNALLNTVGIAPVPWLSDATWTFVAMLIVNIWLGIPFMMVIILGGLQSIPGDFYEAAEMDGANAWQQFWGITIPMLRPVLTPAIILGTIWTFNNFNVPFLLNGGGPSEHTNTLVSALYSVAFTAPNQYAFGSALSLVIFLMLLGFSIYYIRASGGLKSVYE